MNHTFLFLVKDRWQESQFNWAPVKIKVFILKLRENRIQKRNMPGTGPHIILEFCPSKGHIYKKGGQKQSIQRQILRQQ